MNSIKTTIAAALTAAFGAQAYAEDALKAIPPAIQNIISTEPLSTSLSAVLGNALDANKTLTSSLGSINNILSSPAITPQLAPLINSAITDALSKTPAAPAPKHP